MKCSPPPGEASAVGRRVAAGLRSSGAVLSRRQGRGVICCRDENCCDGCVGSEGRWCLGGLRARLQEKKRLPPPPRRPHTQGRCRDERPTDDLMMTTPPSHQFAPINPSYCQPPRAHNHTHTAMLAAQRRAAASVGRCSTASRSLVVSARAMSAAADKVSWRGATVVLVGLPRGLPGVARQHAAPGCAAPLTG